MKLIKTCIFINHLLKINLIQNVFADKAYFNSKKIFLFKIKLYILLNNKLYYNNFFIKVKN